MATNGSGGVDPAMLGEDLSTPPAIDADTQTPTEPPAPAVDEGGHADENLSSEGEPDADKVKAALREYGKLPQTQAQIKQLEEDLAKERADKVRLTEAETRLKTVETNALKSPEKYKRALVEYSGWDEASADAEVSRLKTQGLWQEETTTPQVPANQRPLTAADVEKMLTAREDANTLQKTFFEELPELEPSNVSAERKPYMKTLTSAIEYEARQKLIREGKDLTPQNIAREAVNVYKAFTGVSDEQLQKARENGMLQRKLETGAEKGSVTKSAKGVSSKEESFGLSAKEIQQAEAEGLSLEEFAKLKDPVSIVG